MIGPTLLLRVRVPGRAVTGNPSRNGRAERLQFRRRVQYAVRAAFWTRPVPPRAPLGVRIEVRRPCGTRGDADNIAKPVLDALHEVFGVDRHGRVNDHRVHRLHVEIFEFPSGHGLEETILEIHNVTLSGRTNTTSARRSAS